MTVEARYRPEHIITQDTEKITFCLFKMVKESGNRSSVAESHKCGMSCLGPLTFHNQAVGAKVCLSQGGLLAERTETTFKNGLVFSSRPIKTEEKIRLRVKKDLFNWNGALRVGFTNVSPSHRSLPLPIMAIPDLTSRPGHWAAPVPESVCRAGSELEFWVSCKGTIYITSNSGQYKLLTGVDLSRPLWAMIDIYGQTCSILLLGSKKKGFYTKRSCPAPEHLSSHVVNHDSYDSDGSSDDSMSCLDIPADEGSVTDCVVCMVKESRITLPCGHRCLCSKCYPKYIQQFGFCPLCRHEF